MTSELDTLKMLRQSLDQEDDDASILPILSNHHKYLKEYANVMISPKSTVNLKQDVAHLFFTIFEMHSGAEKKSLYKALKQSTNEDLRLEGLRSLDEHEYATDLVSELKNMGCMYMWSNPIEAKMNVLSEIVLNHLNGEEKVMFPMTEKYISEEMLMDLADNYLEHCRIFLDTQMRDLPSEVSRSDVMSFV